MDSYVLDLAVLLLFAMIPPIVLKRIIKKYVVWRILVGPSGLVGVIIGYYLISKVSFL